MKKALLPILLLCGYFNLQSSVADAPKNGGTDHEDSAVVRQEDPPVDHDVSAAPALPEDKDDLPKELQNA